MKKLSSTEAGLKKNALLIKKTCIRIIFTDTMYTILYKLHCEIQLTYWNLSYMQCNTLQALRLIEY